MRKIMIDELKEILEKHKKWLNDEGGKKADLRGADLQYVDLRYVDLRYANLQSADLSDADLSGADLSGADLQKTNLQSADLRGANLQFANLMHTNLYGADLQKANLLFANLNDADLSGADLRGANLQFAKRRWFVYTGAIGSRNAETLYFADYDNIRCGCWNNYNGGTLAEFKARINKVYPACNKDELCQQYRIEYLSAIKMFEFMRESYLKSATEETNNS